MSVIYIKNTDITQHKWAGQYVQPNEYYLIENTELVNWQNNSQLLTDIGNGIAIVAKTNDNTTDIIDVNEAINYLKGLGIQEVKVTEQIQSSPFASKVLENGKKLFAREHGIPETTIAAGTTVALLFEVPYTSCKITGAHIVGCKKGDTCNFKILDTDAGTLTGVPLYPVNQFGFDVNMPNDSYEKRYNYDADLFQGLHIDVEYTNNGTEEVKVSVNLDLHEVRD